MKKSEYLPDIKPTRRKHDSGYRIFEVGMCKVSNAKVVDKKVIGECTDHVYTDYMVLIDKKPFSINIDLTVDGYIRFFSHQGDLEWDCKEFALSSMGLVINNWYKK